MCTRQARRQAWARNKQGDSPASCSRPRPHRTARACYQRPQTYPQVRAAGPPRQAFPAVPILHLSPLLCRAALYLSARSSVIPSAFCQRYPRYCRRYIASCCFASGTTISSHACSPGIATPRPRCICPPRVHLYSVSSDRSLHNRSDTPTPNPFRISP